MTATPTEPPPTEPPPTEPPPTEPPPAEAFPAEPPPAEASAPSADDAVGTNRWYLSRAPLLRALVHLCVPMAAGTAVSAVYNVINSGFVGSLHSTAMLAAITFGTPMLALVLAFGGVFGVGGGALVSRLLGAAEREPAKAGEIRHVSSFAVWGSVIAGAVIGGIGLLLTGPIVSVLGADGAAAGPTRHYVTVMLAFVPVLAASLCLENLVRAEGAARQAMTGLILSTVGNLVFDVLFILVLDWNVAGAAAAVGLGNAVSLAYWAFWLHRNSEHMSLSPRWFTLRATVLKPVFGVGGGQLLQAGFMVVTSLLLNNYAAHYGDGPLAAMGVAVRIAQVPEFLLMGVTIGVLPLLAYAYGKGDRARLNASLRASATAVGVVGLLFFAAIIGFREQVLKIFSSDDSVLAFGTTVLLAQLVGMIGNGFTGLLTTLFQAAGRARPSLVMASAPGVLFIPTVILGNHWFGLDGVIWSLTATEVIVLFIGLGMWLASRGAIDKGLAEGSPERAEEVLEEV